MGDQIAAVDPATNRLRRDLKVFSRLTDGQQGGDGGLEHVDGVSRHGVFFHRWEWGRRVQKEKRTASMTDRQQGCSGLPGGREGGQGRPEPDRA